MTGYQDLEGQLLDAIAQRASRRQHRGATVVLLASGALVVAVAAFAVIALGHRKPPAPGPTAGATPPPHASQGDVKSVNAAIAATLRHNAACRPAHSGKWTGATISQGAPSAQLLSELAVLRRPATPADRLPARFYSNGRLLLAPFASGIYVRYIRRARVVNGVSYYVIPAARFGWPPASVKALARCNAQEEQALRREVAAAPPAKRAAIRSYAETLLAQMRAERANTAPHEGIWEFAWGPGAGEGTGGLSAQMLAKRGTLDSEGRVVHGIVPDGVASVTLEYPGQPALTVNAADNVFVATLPRGDGGKFPPKVVWRSASGRVIRTVISR